MSFHLSFFRTVQAMPIYEYYSPDTNKIYSFYAKTLAQGQRVPKCPDDPEARMVKLVSAFAIGSHGKSDFPESAGAETAGEAPDDARLEAAMSAMEREFANVDENDPRAMARMMRRMAELSGEKLDEPMEEAVRKLEEGADPESIEEQLADVFGDGEMDEGDAFDRPPTDAASATKEPKTRFKPTRRRPPTRDPKLYDYD